MPLVLDMHVYNPATKQFVLFERWKIIYQKASEDNNNNNSNTSSALGGGTRLPSGVFSNLSRRLVTLMRTLYCFVLMLPGTVG